MIKHKCNWIKWFGYDAITFGNHVFITPEEYDNQKLLAHEQAHLDQYKREGFIKFILKYIYYHCKYGYYNNPFEVEARKLSNT